jgi:hypothetical protein
VLALEGDEIVWDSGRVYSQQTAQVRGERVRDKWNDKNKK